MEEKKVSVSLKELHDLDKLSIEFLELQSKIRNWLHKVKVRLPLDWDQPFIIEEECDEEREKLAKFLGR